MALSNVFSCLPRPRTNRGTEGKLYPMPVVLEGSLSHFGCAEILTFLTSRGGSGTLELEWGEKRAQLVFEGKALVAGGAAGGGGQTFTIFDAFGWSEGRFRVLAAKAQTDALQKFDLDLPTFLAEVERRHLASRYPPDRRFAIVEDAATQREVNLSGFRLRILSRLGEPRSFAELAAELSANPLELARELGELEALGVIALDGATPSVPQSAGVPENESSLMGSLTSDDGSEVHPLLDDEASIGRVASNAIILSDASVSSSHARVLRTPEGFAIEDLQSRNGTFVNGEKVTGRRILGDGDRLRLGRILLTFNLAHAPSGADETWAGKRDA